MQLVLNIVSYLIIPKLRHKIKAYVRMYAYDLILLCVMFISIRDSHWRGVIFWKTNSVLKKSYSYNNEKEVVIADTKKSQLLIYSRLSVYHLTVRDGIDEKTKNFCYNP